MVDNFFDPMQDTPFTPSSNLPADDPLRDWAAQLQDPKLMELMASDPAAAVEKMKELGVPPPPPTISRYAEGGLGDDRSRTMAVPSQTIGGAPPPAPPTYPPAGDPMRAGTRPKSIVERGVDAVTGLFADGSRPDPTAAQGPFRLDRGATPPVESLPAPAATSTAGAFLNPPILEAEENPSAGQPLVPRARPAEAGPTEASAQRRPSASDALSDFSKSLAGVKPVAPPPANFVGTPSAPRPNQIQAPQLQQLLALAGQAQSPLGLTLGRLLATGKA